MHDFSGFSSHVLDDKRRVNLPKRLFDAIEPELTRGKKFKLTLGPDGCLLLMAEETWNREADSLERNYFSDEQARQRRRLLVGFAEDGTPDKTARLSLPELLREAAGIDAMVGQVLLHGCGEVIEIWSPVRWNERVKDSLKTASKLFDRIPATAGPTVTQSRS